MLFVKLLLWLSSSKINNTTLSTQVIQYKAANPYPYYALQYQSPFIPQQLLMKSRNNRIRTDYDHSHSKQKQLVQLRRKRQSALSMQPQTFITRTLNNINHQTNYDSLNAQQIHAEKEVLQRKVKEINQIINHLLGRQVYKKSSRAQSKATISHDMGMDYSALSKEAHSNQNRINSLQDQLNENTYKLAGLNSIDSKIDYGRRVAETEMRIKELKEQLGRIKKNKLMREKQIMKGNLKESQQIQDLQQQYVNTTRKSQLIQSRLQALHQELADTEFSLQKQNQYYNQVKVQFEVIAQLQDKLQTQKQEAHLQYNTRKRKVQLYSKRSEKQQETKKKKYYNLLLQFQQYKTRERNIEQKIINVQNKNQKVIAELEKVLSNLKSISLMKPIRKSTHHYQKTQQIQHETPFITNAQQRQYISQSTDKHSSPFNNKSINQNQLNKANASRSLVRKWNLQGSIVHQKLSPNNMQQIQLMDEVQSDEEGENRVSYQIASKVSNRSRASKQIRHFKTQVSNAQSFIKDQVPPQQEYQQDFQN